MDHGRWTTGHEPPMTPTRGYATGRRTPTLHPPLRQGRGGRDARRLAPLSVLLCLLAAALACGRPQATHTPPVTDGPVAAPAPFTIALEYAMLGLGEAYAPTGVSFAKPMPVYSVWGNLEPEPGKWVWGPLDALVSEYQSAGFEGLQVLLTAESPWAASRQPKPGDLGTTFPQEQYLGDYAAYVTAVVERYDGDGQADMPGLRGGVHQWGVEREFTGYWPGTAEEYVRLLRIAYPAIHAADPQAQVLLVALLLTDGFDGSPARAESERRLAKEASFRKSLDETLTILAECDAYDVVDFHALGHYTEIAPTAAWIRDQLAANGCAERPIWIGDAFPMSAMVAFGGFVPPMPVAPVTLATRDQVVALLKAVADPADPAHAASKAWLEAEVAKGLVKKIVASAGAGVAGINVGNLEDWTDGPARRRQAGGALAGGIDVHGADGYRHHPGECRAAPSPSRATCRRRHAEPATCAPALPRSGWRRHGSRALSRSGRWTWGRGCGRTDSSGRQGRCGSCGTTTAGCTCRERCRPRRRSRCRLGRSARG